MLKEANKTFLGAILLIITILILIGIFSKYNFSQQNRVVGDALSSQVLAGSSVRDGDWYLGNSLYEWDLEGLLVPDFQFGIENDFVANDPSDNPAPLGTGMCYALPDDYIKICFDSIRDTPYNDLKLEFDQGIDFTRAGFPTWTSEPGISISYLEND